MACRRSRSLGDLIICLREERRRQGLTILTLETRLGVCRNYIEKMENGLARPSGFMLSCWAWALGLRLRLTPLEEADLTREPRRAAPDRIRRRLPIAGPLAH